MRPIERGPAPRSYAAYGDAIGDLRERLGSYCSYCERRLPASLAVEHVAPKSLYPDRELVWDNFLLGCANCNSVKGEKDVNDDDTLWPDRHNTMLALGYWKGGFVCVVQGLRPDIGRRARVLIDLVGLDRHDASGWPQPADRDERWKQRAEVWAAAERCRANFETLGKSNQALELIIDVAKGFGFFSVWFTMFDGYDKVRRVLIETFPGTATSCFDEKGEAIKRRGSVI